MHKGLLIGRIDFTVLAIICPFVGNSFFGSK